MRPLSSKGITAEERLRLKRYNRKISKKSRVGFNMLVQSMGTIAVSNVISSNCEIEDIRGAWNAIWDKHDSKKPAMKSQIANRIFQLFAHAG